MDFSGFEVHGFQRARSGQIFPGITRGALCFLVDLSVFAMGESGSVSAV